MEILFLFILGLFVGSFLNVLIDRLPREEQVLRGRSYCESCSKIIRWYDLIPIVSFLLLKAKCRHCRFPLSLYYPIVELTAGIMFALTFFLLFTSEESFGHLRGGTKSLLGGDFLELGYHLFIVASLIVIFFTDLKYGIIPDKVVFSGIVVSLLYLFMIRNSLFMIHLLSGLGSFLFFLVIFLATRGRGMGFGDVKFAFLIGLLLGFPKTIVGLYVAFLTGAVVSIMLILIGKKKLRGSTVPFGPFLVIGTLAALFWGDIMLQIVFPFL